MRWSVAALAAAGMLLCWAVLAGWRAGPLDVSGVLVTAQGSLVAALSLVLALRAWADPRARRVAVGFLWIGLYWPASFGRAPFAFPLTLLCDVLQGVGMAALVVFAARWDATPPRFVRAAVLAAYIGGALTSVDNLAGDLSGNAGSALAFERAFFAGMIVLLIAALLVSLIHARGIQRRRIGWVTVSFSSAFVPWALYELFAVTGHASAVWNWVTIVDFAMPLGFGYALLRHRVLDLG